MECSLVGLESERNIVKNISVSTSPHLLCVLLCVSVCNFITVLCPLLLHHLKKLHNDVYNLCEYIITACVTAVECSMMLARMLRVKLAVGCSKMNTVYCTCL